MMTAEQTTTWVKGYLQLGWNVLPLPPMKKASPPDGTTGADGADLTEAQVLAALEPGGNLGLRMPDGVVGIDVDAYGEKDGAGTLFATQMLHGYLPDSPRLTSRPDDPFSGIRFYRVPPGYELGFIGKDVDTIRRSWRYAVAAPSVHPEGRKYQWLDGDGNPRKPPAVSELPELPKAWLEAFELKAGAGSALAGTGLHGRQLIEHAKRWFSELPKGLPECSSVADAREEGLVAASRKGKSGTARNDLLGPVLKLALQGEAGCPGVREAVTEIGKRYVALPDGEDHSEKFWHLLGSTLDRIGAASPWECDHLTREERDMLPEVASSLPAVSGGPAGTIADGEVPELGENRYGYVDFADEAFWNPPPPVYFIPGMLIEGEVCTIYSAGGKGKSLLAQDIVLGLVERGTVFGEKVALQDVLYIDRENSARGLAKRFRDMGHPRGALPRLHYSLLGQWPSLDTREGGAALLAEVRRTGARLVVLDTMSKMVDGEENANDTWNGLHSYSMVALKQAGVTVIQLDHTGKDAEKGQRGGSSKQNNADVIWKLEYAAGYVTLRNEKDREGEYEPLVYLERQEVPVLVHRPTTALPAAASKAIEDALQVDELVEMLDGLKVPEKAGRPKCMEALRAAYPDVRITTELLAEAVKKRKGTA